MSNQTVQIVLENMGNLHTYTTGDDVSESMRSEPTEALAPVLTNNGDIHATAISAMSLLVFSRSPDFIMKLTPHGYKLKKMILMENMCMVMGLRVSLA